MYRCAQKGTCMHSCMYVRADKQVYVCRKLTCFKKAYDKWYYAFQKRTRHYLAACLMWGGEQVDGRLHTHTPLHTHTHTHTHTRTHTHTYDLCDMICVHAHIQAHSPTAFSRTRTHLVGVFTCVLSFEHMCAYTIHTHTRAHSVKETKT